MERFVSDYPTITKSNQAFIEVHFILIKETITPNLAVV
jgi:hypothetical protein